MKVNSREDACNLLETFIRSNILITEMGFREIRIHERSLTNLFEIPLVDGYNIDAWLRDGRINDDLKIRFKEILTTAPLMTNEELKGNDVYEVSEFFKIFENEKKQVWGLGAAYIFDTLAISLATHPEWQKSEVDIIHIYLDENLSEVRKNVMVRNISNENTIRDNENWWNEKQISSLMDGVELWDKRSEFFPNLEFCPEVEIQLKGIGNLKMLSQIVDRLKTLDVYVKNWNNGNFNYEDVNANTNLKISPESKTTIRKFGSLRKFSIPGRGKEIFDLHIKTGNLRFHLFPDNNNRVVYIGYIGRHLRISSED